MIRKYRTDYKSFGGMEGSVKLGQQCYTGNAEEE
jgi:hypothetical protein